MTYKKLTKAEIISSGLFKNAKQARHAQYVYGDMSPRNALIGDFGFENYMQAVNLAKSSTKRKLRVWSKIVGLAKIGQLYFLTLTFRDDVLVNTSKETRRRYVSRFLKMCSPVYVANIDFGGKNGREHYHAVTSHPVDLELWRKACGSINAKKVRANPKDEKRVSAYVAKLTNHALKVGANKGDRLIYSRSPKIDFDNEF